jgi:hypothetical protein
VNVKKLKWTYGPMMLYQHHGAYWIYYREDKTAVRKQIADNRADAEKIAARRALQLLEPNGGHVAAGESAASSELIPAEITQRFLDFRDQVQHSSPRTISRYRNALQHEANPRAHPTYQ